MSLAKLLADLAEKEQALDAAKNEPFTPTWVEKRDYDEALDAVIAALWDHIEPKVDRLIEAHVRRAHDGNDLH